MKDLNWKEAEDCFYTIKRYYEEIPEGKLALAIVFQPIENRYLAGERTEELYRDMMEVE